MKKRGGFSDFVCGRVVGVRWARLNNSETIDLLRPFCTATSKVYKDYNQKKLNKNQSNVFKYKHLIRIQTAECKMGSCKSFGRKCLMVIKSSHDLPDSKHVNVTEYSLDFQNKITSILTDASGLMFTAAGSN